MMLEIVSGACTRCSKAECVSPGSSRRKPGASRCKRRNLSHAPGCLPSTDPGDQSYPQYNVFSRASIGECGVDWRGLALFDPQTTSDYMSYCQPVWTSPYGYNQILTALQSGAFSPESASPLMNDPEDPKGAEYQYINFCVNERATAESRVIVVSSFHIPRPRQLHLGWTGPGCGEDRDGVAS